MAIYLSWRQRRILATLAALPDDAPGLLAASLGNLDRNTCNSLVRRDLVTISGRFTPRQRYRITGAGRDEWARWQEAERRVAP